MKKSIHIIIALLGLIPVSFGQITLDSTTLTTSVVATDLDTPWEILWAPDHHIWFTERRGVVSRVDPETKKVEKLLDIQNLVIEESESGLLGMALHPDFLNPDSQFVYLVYTYEDENFLKIENLVRYTFNGTELVDPLTLLDNIPANNNHSGSRVIVTPDRKLLMSTGDAQNTSNSQDANSLAGKFLRLNLDGSVPSDNPIAGQYLWTKGHRNPQGIVAANGRIYSSEHGPSNDDELNIITKDGNFGWPNVEGFCNSSSEKVFCANNNVTEPISAWTPTLAVAGIDYYNHSAIPEWQNSLIMATLKQNDIRVLTLNENGDEVISEKIFFDNQYGRLRDVCVSHRGDVYLSTSNKDGRGNNSADKIIKISNLNYVITALNSRNSISVQLYPNPSNSAFELKGEGDFVIVDAFGLEVESGACAGNCQVGAQLTEGVYFLELKNNDSIAKLKLIKQ